MSSTQALQNHPAAPFAAKNYAMQSNALMVATDASPPVFVQRRGIKKLDNFPLYSNEYINITARESRSYFGEMFGGLLAYSLRTSESMGALLDAGGQAEAGLSVTFPGTTLGLQLKQVAKVVHSRGVLSSERDVFVTSLGGFVSNFRHSPSVLV